MITGIEKRKIVEYRKLKAQLDLISSKMDEIKEYMKPFVQEDGTIKYKGVTLTWVEFEKINYDKETLEALFSAKQLKPAKKVIPQEFVKISVGREK